MKDLFRKAGTVLRADVSLGPDNRSRGYGTVLLATAEDAGRAVDMFNGYTWQTRVLEVRLDRLMPEYELGRVGIGSSVGVAMPGVVPGVSAPSSGSTLYLGLGISGSGSGGGAVNSTTHTALLPSDAGPNSHFRASHFVQSFVPSRPSSSSAAVQDPLDFLHSSAFTSSATELDSTANRTLFVGNVGYSYHHLFRFITCCSLQLPFHIQWQDLKDLFRQAGTILRADVALGPDNRSRGFGTVVFATEADTERAAKMFNGLVIFFLSFHLGSIVINSCFMRDFL